MIFCENDLQPRQTLESTPQGAPADRVSDHELNGAQPLNLNTYDRNRCGNPPWFLGLAMKDFNSKGTSGRTFICFAHFQFVRAQTGYPQRLLKLPEAFQGQNSPISHRGQIV
jgi:hypothetical protein